ncbi:MAG: hypothetical protein LBL07_03775 [Tannerella sp.]|jgi:hypothetical protein|nr:hypothetical protein [Tannerella sp.]
MDTKETKDKKYANALYDSIYKSIVKDTESFEAKITRIAFGMTVIFIAYIISKGSGLICLPVGIIGASSLLLCLISDISSFLIGVMVKMKCAGILKKYIEQSIPASIDLDDMANKLGRGIDARNWLSAILLFTGIILTAIFIFINI